MKIHVVPSLLDSNGDDGYELFDVRVGHKTLKKKTELIHTIFVGRRMTVGVCSRCGSLDVINQP